MSWLRRRSEAGASLEERFRESEQLRQRSEAMVAQLQQELAAIRTATAGGSAPLSGQAAQEPGGDEAPSRPVSAPSGASRLLVIGPQRTNYVERFAGQSVHGKAVEVEQCRWDELSLCSYGSGGLLASIAPSMHPLPGTCLLYTSPSPRDGLLSRMPSSA